MLSPRDPSKENSLAGKDRLNRPSTLVESTKAPKVKSSPSLWSIKPFVTKRRSSAEIDRPIHISQPVLDNSSHEKVRNRLKHSPSMMSINALNGEVELYTNAEKNLVDAFLSRTKTRCVETGFDLDAMREDNPDKIYASVDLARYDVATHTLQSFTIHDALAAKCAGFCTFDNIYLVPTEPGSTQLSCVSEMPKWGIHLDAFLFEHPSETVDVFLKVAQSLAQGEIEAQLEHRNLHPGNILAERTETGAIGRVTIIGCGLARMTCEFNTCAADIGTNRGTTNSNKQVLFTRLDHPEFYKPKLPVLSQMRELVTDPSAFVPATNVLWLRYLVRFLYNRFPNNQLKKIEAILSPKWALKRPPRSAVDALNKINRRMNSTHS